MNNSEKTRLLTPQLFMTLGRNTFDIESIKDDKILVSLDGGDFVYRNVYDMTEYQLKEIIKKSNNSSLNELILKAYKKKNSNNWSGKGADRVLQKFRYGFKNFRWEDGGMYHVVLKTNYIPDFTPSEYNKYIAERFGELKHCIDRGKKKLDLIYHQAIVEFDEYNPKQEYRTMHLHFFIQKSAKNRVSVENKINHYWRDNWGVGECSYSKKIESRVYFHNCIDYCTKPKVDKTYQMKLPEEYKYCTNIKRVFYPIKNKIDGSNTSFSFILKFKDKVRDVMTESLRRKVKEWEEVPSNGSVSQENTHSIADKKPRSQRKKRQPLSYKEREESDRVALRVRKHGESREQYDEVNVPMSIFKRLKGEFDSSKAFCVPLSQRALDEIKILGELRDLADQQKPRPKGFEKVIQAHRKGH